MPIRADDGRMRRVVIVAYPGVQTLDVTGPAEVSAGGLALHPPGYEVSVAAAERGRSEARPWR